MVLSHEKSIIHTVSEKVFLQCETVSKSQKIGVFDQRKEQLDEFFFQNPNFSLSSEIKPVIKMALVLIHGKASFTQFPKKHSCNVELFQKIKQNGVFEQKKERLDELYFQNQNFLLPSEIRSVIKLVLVLIHGQASVESGFNINKSVNIIQYTLRFSDCQKTYRQHAEEKDLKLSNIELLSRMIRSVKASRQRYSAYLEEQKKIKEKCKKNDQIEY